NGNQASYENRLQMLKSAFSGTPNLSISTVENELPKPSFSVVTIRHLKEKYPGRTFYYCMGEDNLAHFNQWKFYNEILIECELLVAKRPGADHSQVEQKILERTHFAEHTPLEVSSSQIKEKLQKGESIQECVPEGVLEIIQKERLYL
ncbi:MAG: nicotinate-nicotinamide nucleotide adenylyltransferase, partial [Balneolaceae bacterium]